MWLEGGDLWTSSVAPLQRPKGRLSDEAPTAGVQAAHHLGPRGRTAS